MNSTTDWYDVDGHIDGVTVISEPLKDSRTNVFVIEGENKNLVIDAGRGIGDLKGLLAELSGLPVQVLLTHSHWDHIGNAYQFDDVLIHPRERTSDGSVAIDGLSDEFIGRPTQYVQKYSSDSFPDNFDRKSFTIRPAHDVKTCVEGDTIDIGNKILEVYEIPGHTPGQVAILDEDSGILFGGDILHANKCLFIHFQDSNVEDYIHSLRKVIDLRDDGKFDTLLTSHNLPIVGKDLDILDRLYEKLLSIKSESADFEIVDTPWGEAREYWAGESKILTKMDL